MTEQDKIWLHEHVNNVLLAPTPTEYEDDDYDISVLLAVDVYVYASTTITFSSKDPKQRVLESMTFGQELWEYLCDYIETLNEDIICQKFGFLSVLMVLSKLKEQWFQDAVQDTASEILKKRGPLLFKDPVPMFPAMDQGEVDQIINSIDANLVTEFFNLFRELKVFYVDPSKYDDPEDAEKQKRMMAIFSKMIQNPNTQN